MANFFPLYHSFPHPLKNIVASLRGYQLRSWRYGKNFDELVDNALERETWDNKQWDEWQAENLSHILYRAATQVPYYQEYWQKLRKHKNRSSWEYLENWPLLTKEILRSQPRAFLTDGTNPRKMF